MKKGILKKVVIGTISTVVLLIAMLCVHIYLVTRPKAPDANTVALARIDMKQDINDADAAKIGTWLSAQKGVDHYTCNTKTNIIIFSFHPAIVSANFLVADLQSTLHYKAQRYMPSEEEMKGGCPIATTSVSYRAYSFIKEIF